MTHETPIRLVFYVSYSHVFQVCSGEIELFSFCLVFCVSYFPLVPCMQGRGLTVLFSQRAVCPILYFKLIHLMVHISWLDLPITKKQNKTIRPLHSILETSGKYDTYMHEYLSIKSIHLLSLESSSNFGLQWHDLEYFKVLMNVVYVYIRDVTLE